MLLLTIGMYPVVHKGNCHWAKRYVPTTLGIHWVCIGNILNPAN